MDEESLVAVQFYIVYTITCYKQKHTDDKKDCYIEYFS